MNKRARIVAVVAACLLVAGVVVASLILYLGNGSAREPGIGSNDNISGKYYYDFAVVESVVSEGGRSFGKPLYFDKDSGIIFMEKNPNAIYKTTEDGQREMLFEIPDLNDISDYPTEEEVDALGQEAYFGLYAVRSFTLDEDGNFYILYSQMGSGNYVLSVYNKKGSPLTTGIEIVNLRNGDYIGDVDQFRYYDDKVYIFFNYELQVNSLDGELLGHPFGDIIHGLDIDPAGNFYVITSKNDATGTRELLKADIAHNYSIVERISVPDACSFVAYYDAENTAYIGNHQKIYSYDFSASRLQTELTFGDTADLLFASVASIGLPAMEGFRVSPTGDIYLVTNGDLENRIYRLIKTAGKKPERNTTTTITITAAYKQQFLDEAVKRFALDYPEVEIVWDVFYNTQEQFYANMESAKQKLAVKIMSNDVGDIVATGGMGLVYLDLLKTDAFVDLSSYIQQDENYPLLNQHVLDGITLDGKLNGLPLGTAYMKLVYTKTVGEEMGLSLTSPIQWSEILKIGLDYPDTSLFGSMNLAPNSLENAPLIDMLIAQIPDLIDLDTKEINLHQDWFLQLLSDYKAVHQQGNLITSMSGTILDKHDRTHLFEIQNIRGQYEHQQLYYELAEGTIAYWPMPSGEINRNSVAYPLFMYSISSNSMEKDAAWSFLSYLLTENVQLIPSFDASPINQNAEERKRQWVGGFPDEAEKEFAEIINTVDYLYDMGEYKQDLANPIWKYIQDEISLEEALDEAEYNIWIRINE